MYPALHGMHSGANDDDDDWVMFFSFLNPSARRRKKGSESSIHSRIGENCCVSCNDVLERDPFGWANLKGVISTTLRYREVSDTRFQRFLRFATFETEGGSLRYLD